MPQCCIKRPKLQLWALGMSCFFQKKEIFFRFISDCINSWACSILLYSALISIMTPKCQFPASHSGSLEENGSQIFFFLAFILIQNESILNTEPCGNGEEIQTLSPQVGDFIRISISESTANSFLCCYGIPGCGTFPRHPSYAPFCSFKTALPSHLTPAD